MDRPNQKVYSKLSIQQPILHGLGDVVFVDLVGAIDISNRPRDSADFIIRTGAQAHLIHGLLHEEQARVAQVAELLELAGIHAGVGGAVAETLELGAAGAEHLLPHRLAIGAGPSAGQLAIGNGGDFDMDIDAIEQWARQLGKVSIAAFSLRLAIGISAGAWIHRGNQHEFSRETD